MQLKIQVTKTEIEFAKKNDHFQCMVAQAIQKANDDFIYVIVKHDEIRLTARSTGTRYLYKTPKRVSSFIDTWESGGEVKPFTLHLKEELYRWPMSHAVVTRKDPKPSARVVGSRKYRRSMVRGRA